MQYSFGKTVVMALGGSILFPDEIDVAFVRRFKRLVEEFTGEGKRLVLVVGGGKLARIYQDAASRITRLADDEKDWIGIHATRSNAQLLHAVFGKLCEPVVFDERGKLKRLRYPVTVGSGWRPGWSTDYVTSVIAHDLGVPEFVIAGKPDHVYDRDPHHHLDAMSFEHLTWNKYRKLIPKKWVPGASAPVDPVAAEFAEQNGLKAVVIDGRRLANLKRLLKGQNFKGTLIE